MLIPFNRTILELKEYIIINKTKKTNTFNRTILELKDGNKNQI